jgi:hypothetical protein
MGYYAREEVKNGKTHVLIDSEGLPMRVVVHSAVIQDRDVPMVLHKIRRRSPLIPGCKSSCMMLRRLRADEECSGNGQFTRPACAERSEAALRRIRVRGSFGRHLWLRAVAKYPSPHPPRKPNTPSAIRQ